MIPLFTRWIAGPVLRRRAMASALAVAAVAVALPAHAQRRSTAPETIVSGTPGQPDFKIPKRSGGFKLFANGDLAGTGMKMTGNFGWGLSNLGPCSDGFALFECGDVNQNFNLFELNIVAATPPTEFKKLRNLYSGVGTATGGGYSEVLSSALITGRLEWGPGDGTLGALFSGATSTADGSCRDNTSWLDGYMTVGVSLLAGNSCPDTWAASGFQGAKVVSDSAFIRAFNQDKNKYAFNEWQIDPSETANSKTLGDFSTYGEISDHYNEILQSYGSVTPAYPTRTPIIGGYPLGLDIHFDAYSFARPSLKNVVFYRMLVINNSAKLYGGNGVDYDSLYFGLEEGFGGSPQNNNIYFEPWDNAVKAALSGTSGTGNCNNAIAPSGVSGCGTNGFSGGAIGWIILKSPIGDTRYKLFSDPTSPFYNPANIYAGDTITFNHGHICGYGGCYANTHQAGDRSGFGQTASNPTATLNDRLPGSLAASDFWREFHNFDFPARTPAFNSYVPGNWDYNADGIPDTIFFDTCHGNPGPASVQCVTTWADTMPGKQVNNYGNVGGVADAGPFALKAGDTTSWVMAMFGAPDSSTFEATARSLIDSYKTFYLGPEPPPVPPVTAQEVGVSELVPPFVTIYTNTAVDKYIDPYLAKSASDIRASNLETLNPGLADSIDARASSNFGDLLVFKSCDGGNTFTADNTCTAAPSVDAKGSPIGVGWRAYAIIEPDPATGLPSGKYTDANVIGGKTYLYSFVTRSKGFQTPINDVDIGNNPIRRMLQLADTSISALQRSGPSVAKVYVPISMVAGGNAASAKTTIVAGASTIPVGLEFGSKVTPGAYTMNFGNRFIVHTIKDTLTGAVTSQVALQTIAAHAQVNGGSTDTNVVESTASFLGSGLMQWTDGEIFANPTDSANTKIETDVINGFGFLLAKGGQPYFVSTNLTTAATTPPAFINRTDFPGFILSVNNPAKATTPVTAGTLAEETVIFPGADTVKSGAVLGNNTLQFLEAVSSRQPGISGHYDFTFAQDAFGTDVKNFAINRADPSAIRAQVLASLAARPTVTTGDVSAATAAIIGAAIPAYAGKPLVAVKFPFSVTNTTFNRQVTLAMVKRSSIARDSMIQMGSGNDTISVPIPDDVWVPGDPFVMLETITRDSVVADTAVLDAAKAPIKVTSLRVSLGPVSLGCNTPRASCNPMKFASPGATGYLPYAAQTDLTIRYATRYDNGDKVQLDVAGPTVATTLSKADLNKVRVVPNPYIFQSQFDAVGNQRIADPRILFSGVPDHGTLRVYSVSGQYLQQLTWNAADLNGTGDLPYNLRTREGTDLASGLYIFVITTKDASGKEHTVRGKFVVIR